MDFENKLGFVVLSYLDLNKVPACDFLTTLLINI